MQPAFKRRLLLKAMFAVFAHARGSRAGSDGFWVAQLNLVRSRAQPSGGNFALAAPAVILLRTGAAIG
jgi:hypothetical protein